MSKVIVSLISDQTIPNILFLKEMKGDKYILVSTTQMEKALNAILSIAEIDEEKIEILEVKAWDLNDIAERFSTKITDNEAHYVINITGGTKIMSLGTYQFFSTLNSDFYYLPIGKNAYQKINPSPREIQKFTYKLKVLDYLKCYGLTVESSSNELYSDALTYRFFDLFVDGGLSNQDYSTIGKLRSKLTDSNISAKMNKDLHHLINKMNNSLPKAFKTIQK